MARLLKRPLFQAGFWIAIGLLYLMPLVTSRGAFDAFMKIEGVEGESQDEKHKDWIDISSVQYGTTRTIPAAGTPRAGGAVTFEDIQVTKWIDKSSPDLMLSVCRGKVFPKVEIEMVDRSATSGTNTYLKYELTDVIVTGVKPTAPASDGQPMPSESVSLNFTKIEFKYQKIDAASGATNVETSAICDLNPTGKD